MSITISAGFATSMETPDHVVLAEDFGYERAWLYDSPALYPDVWMQLARAAERTTRIGLGPGVLIPSLRHPMTTAAAIGTLVNLVGSERVHVGVGTGFTGRFTMGQRPLRWADVQAWVMCVKALLEGDTVEWDGGKMRMIHPVGFLTDRPIKVAFVIGAAGPKGKAVAQAVGDGLILAGGSPDSDMEWQAALMSGTVLADDEAVSSDRVFEAAGHTAAVAYHFFAENGLGVENLPGGPEWVAAYADLPADERHLAMHSEHLVAVNERDKPFITPEIIEMFGSAWTPAQLRSKLGEMEASGVTEVVYQPAGPDIERELATFIEAAKG